MTTITRLLITSTLLVAGLTASPGASAAQAPAAGPAICASDSSFQRLAFWVGDWVVVDTAGKPYATQRVHEAVDGCALTVEWNGRAGSKGLSIFAYDRRAAEWRQVYVGNQLPTPSGVQLRRSDPTYSGPGIRFIALLDPPAGTLNRSRVTIMPLADHRAVQLFEDSRDGGNSWQVTFRGEHRAQPPR